MKVEVADLESITLGRRLKEILSDKGKAFSLRAMEMKTGISKDVLLRIMKGERYYKTLRDRIGCESPRFDHRAIQRKRYSETFRRDQ